jgi:hypothetical protein
MNFAWLGCLYAGLLIYNAIVMSSHALRVTVLFRMESRHLTTLRFVG